MPSSHRTPLARLMAMALRSLVDELHYRLGERGMDAKPTFAFVLLASRDHPLTGNDLATLLGMTKQAASKVVDAMEAEGYVHRKPNPEDARSKILHVTAKGRRFLEAAETIYAE